VETVRRKRSFKGVIEGRSFKCLIGFISLWECVLMQSGDERMVGYVSQ